MKDEIPLNNGTPPDDEIDIFDEDGALSRDFLLQRGYCCENGCKNCPYGFHKTRRAEMNRDEQDKAG